MNINNIIGLSVGILAILYWIKIMVFLPKIGTHDIYHSFGLESNGETSFERIYKSHLLVVRFIMFGTDEYISVSVKHKTKIMADISISKETITSKSQKLIGINDILTGDNRFDSSILIKGNNPQFLISLLHEKIREKILLLSKKSKLMEIKNHSILIEAPLHKFRNINSFKKYMDNMIYVSQEITGENKLKKRILNNLSLETNPKVKIKNIDILVTSFGVDTEIRKILKQTLHDNSIEVQIYSAKHLGATGVKFLLNLLETDYLAEDNLIEIISALKNKNNKKFITSLMKVFVWTSSNKVKLEILDTLREAKLAYTKTFLLEQLNSGNIEVKLKTVEVLGHCGTRDVIEKLFTLGKDSINPVLKKKVNDAISQIQSRLGIVDSGWLSMSEGDEKIGALSISENVDEGALSIIEKKKKMN